MSVCLQVLCPCVKRRERRDVTQNQDERPDDSDSNTLGLSAQDLRDPAAIVSSPPRVWGQHEVCVSIRWCVCLCVRR